ncbi:hypothetical protein [Helicobacter sp. MIT 99-5507]|uniref:hypothetical protein n=1 Tax=Helicobacter sp. MIT 99-5507 TaxID=152489 RepID=UPI000E1F19AD|nr:hypothetical protein [Helicobacter sp. MIT 99-5507]RDU58427.1 hypothetical protein CQA42_01155 [Helicobacter sp. MIT 99-5507]
MRFSFLLPFFAVLFLAASFFYFQWTFSKFKFIDFQNSVLYGKDYIFSPLNDEYIVIFYNSKSSNIFDIIKKIPNEYNLEILAIDFYQDTNKDIKDNIIPLSAGMNTLLKLSNNFHITNLPSYFLIKKKSSFKFIQISKVVKF